MESKVVIASESAISIYSIQDIPDAISACLGVGVLLLTEEDLGPAFFNLRSGLAGELLQKFVNYRIKVAIVVPDPKAHGERFNELAREHRSHPLVRFVSTCTEAIAWLEDS
jgi:hypothetical protein